jgi:hypothetical protein
MSPQCGHEGAEVQPTFDQWRARGEAMRYPGYCPPSLWSPTSEKRNSLAACAAPSALSVITLGAWMIGSST